MSYRVAAIFEVPDPEAWGRLRASLAPPGGEIDLQAWPYDPRRAPAWRVTIVGDLPEGEAAQAVARFLALGALKVDADRSPGERDTSEAERPFRQPPEAAR